MIEFANLTKRYGKFAAVDNLTLSVKPQEAVALWGVNGAGKTTAIKCLLGLLRFDGQITVGGCDVRRQGRAARQLIGYVPQELAFYKEMTTVDMAQFYARLKGAPAARIAPVLAQVGLGEQGGKRVGALSGGMKQRLALALALLGDPPVLVMDEPTSNLDTAARSQLLHLLLEVKRGGKTIIFSSHRIEEVETLADRVAVMEHGRLQFTCTAGELARRVGLRTQVKVLVPGSQLDQALAILQGAGLQARRNGVGVIVDVAHGEKARPIHTLGRANIEVTDFELE
ncbi:MAG: ABC transporter ATP-binding protein [Caldilinea sp.]|nr:ABC transporter ATP-binding protein [Caldilineaceae bacterium]MCO5209034.1 ABC transporter ATP-binding protein [Caldilinea sp.]